MFEYLTVQFTCLQVEIRQQINYGLFSCLQPGYTYFQELQSLEANLEGSDQKSPT